MRFFTVVVDLTKLFGAYRVNLDTGSCKQCKPAIERQYYMTLSELKKLKKDFEADGTQALGVSFTKEQSVELRRELHHYYGFDNGENLTTLWGMEVLDTDAESFSFDD